MIRPYARLILFAACTLLVRTAGLPAVASAEAASPKIFSSFDTTIAHLQVLYNGQQVRTAREYTMTFTDFGLNAPGAAGATAAPQSLKDTADTIRGLFGGGRK